MRLNLNKGKRPMITVKTGDRVKYTELALFRAGQLKGPIAQYRGLLKRVERVVDCMCGTVIWEIPGRKKPFKSELIPLKALERI